MNPVGKRAPQKPRKKSRFQSDKEDEAAAEVYKEFVTSFEEPSKQGCFVRGDVINPNTDGRVSAEMKTGELYMPRKLQENIKKQNVREKTESPVPIKKAKEKKQRNLDLLKEEIKIMQQEREERHRLKAMIADQTGASGVSEFQIGQPLRVTSDFLDNTANLISTNLYLGNLNPNISEQQLCEIFGEFGPLASVKIMWPRNDEERSRGKNCGFVAYMNRKDCECAMKHLDGKEIMEYKMKLDWGKPVPIPPQPVYVPPCLAQLLLPPAPSGLPFNAQPIETDKHKLPPLGTPWPVDAGSKAEFDKILANAVVKVAIPTEKGLLCLINRMVEFVVREGSLFEATIMSREVNNPAFRFLFDNKSPAHVYYRWRLFSILQGDKPNKWKTEEFRMFKGGSIWKPPPVDPYIKGMPDELIKITQIIPLEEENREPKKGVLSADEKETFRNILNKLTPQRDEIAEAMVYCIDQADAAEEVVDTIAEALSTSRADLHRLVALIYLISDVLQNSCVKVSNTSLYRKCFHNKMPDIFKEVHCAFQGIKGRLSSEQFKQKILRCIRAWEDSAIYSNEFLIRLQNVLYGLDKLDDVSENQKLDNSGDLFLPESGKTTFSEELDGISLQSDDTDGVPISEDDIDGVASSDTLGGISFGNSPAAETLGPKFKASKWEAVDPEVLEEQALTSSKWDLLEQNERAKEQLKQSYEVCDDIMPGEDIDGVPLSDDVDSQSNVNSSSTLVPAPKFKSVVWEPVDPKTLQEQAFTTSKWDLLEELEDTREKQNLGGDLDVHTVEVSKDLEEGGDVRDEEKRKSWCPTNEHFNNDAERAKLRDIEIKVMKYQDELEAGDIRRKSNMSFATQVESYRKKLLRKAEKESMGDDVPKRDFVGKRKRNRSRSRSPYRRSRSDSSEKDDESCSSRSRSRSFSSQSSRYDRESSENTVDGKDFGNRRKRRSRSTSRQPGSHALSYEEDSVTRSRSRSSKRHRSSRKRHASPEDHYHRSSSKKPRH